MDTKLESRGARANKGKAKRTAKHDGKLRKTNTGKTSPMAEPTVAPEADGGFPVVGVGASAGGLQALSQLLDGLPEEPGVAIVIVQHLDPTRKSLTAELLGKHTKMRVCEVQDEPNVRPNRVYVIPPDRYLSISGGELHVTEPDRPRGVRMAIDFFLRSLAEEQKNRAVAIILSGSGTDGTLGAKAVKAAGGIVIAQDLATAEHESMPLNAIGAGVVDYVLPPGKMAEVLVGYSARPYVREPIAESTEAQTDNVGADRASADGFGQVLALVRAHTKHDFRNYKENTLHRRTRRRMSLLHVESYEAYVGFLRTHPPEIEALVKDLLITVTDFFRDPESWEELRKLAIRPLVEGKAPDEPIRVWTPGCATGEEPYSMAILILEELMRAEKPCPLNLFASDIDRDAITFARAGRYFKNIAVDVSPDRLRRFFAEEAEHYRVNKLLRESVVFADQDIITDPPFSKLDLICCRNLLIYLRPAVQERIIALFHFALRPGGALFLGSAETIGRQGDLFETLHKRWRIFRRSARTLHDRAEVPVGNWRRRREVPPLHGAPERQQAHVAHLAQQKLLDLVAPPAVLIDSKWKILYVTGNVDPYLTHRSGSPSDNLLDKVRRELRSRLRSAVQKAHSEGSTVSVSARVEHGDAHVPVVISVRAVRDRDPEEEASSLVIFEQPADQGRRARTASSRRTRGARTKRGSVRATEDKVDEKVLVDHLEQELAATKDDLRATIEQLEASNEEYRAANEESMSVNEEMQSTNEELETSKEELQSLNEELSTVNSQLAAKVDELETKHSDLENLILATSMATICLDLSLCVRWFTPAVRQVIRLKESDRGRPLADLAHDFRDGDLVEIAERVLNTLVPVEDEARCLDGRTYLRRLTPYRTDDHRIGGLMLTFVDITRRKEAEIALLQAKELSDRIIDTVRDATLVLDSNLIVQRANRRFYEKFSVLPAETEGRRIYDLGNSEWNIPRLRTLLDGVLVENRTFNDYLVDHEFEGIGRRVMVLNARRLDPGRQILLAIEDITELLAAKESLEGQVKQRTDTLDLLQDITRAANEAQSTEEVMRIALERIASYEGWPVGHVWRQARDGSGTFVDSGIWYTTDKAERAVARVDEFRELCEQARFAPGEGLVGQVALSREARWVDDILHEDNWLRGDAAHLGLRAVIAFPIVVSDQTVAVLEFFSDRPAWRAERFMEIMPGVGIQLGHVIERKRLERDADNAAAEQQRSIGRELHDSIAQQLTGVGMMAETFKVRLVEEGSPLVAQAERLVTQLRTAQRQVSALSRGLIPAEIEGAGLVSALEQLVAECNELRGDGLCKFRCSAPIAVEDPGTATNLYRIAQEAIHNAWKHARPTSIVVSLSLEEGDIVLAIENDGVKEPAGTRKAQGRGLHTMRYRAGLVGARLFIDPQPGRFSVVCRLNPRAQQS